MREQRGNIKKVVKMPLKDFHLRKVVKVYNDAIAIEALEMFE